MLFALAVAGCPSGVVSEDVGSNPLKDATVLDAMPDGGPDASALDASIDGGEDAAMEDATADGGPDASPDASDAAMDAGEVDAGEVDAGDAGPINECDSVPDGTACMSCPAAEHCAGCFGGACLDGRTFCSDVLDRGQSTGDGVYALLPSLTASVAVGTSSIAAYCDMTTDGGGWTMVFKKSRVVPGNAGVLWTATATNTDQLALLDRTLANVDYTNAFQVDYWPTFTEARIEIVTGTVTRAFLQFDLTGSTNLDWFAPDRHTASSWTDLPTDPTWDNGSNQAFRIPGSRSFYINRLWGGCPSDRGWLMISAGNFCYWENRTGDPVDIIYASGTTEALIESQAQTDYGDTFVVLLR